MADAYIRTFTLDEADVFIEEGQQVTYNFFGDTEDDYLMPEPLYQMDFLTGHDPICDIQLDKIFHSAGYYCGLTVRVGYQPGEIGTPGDYTVPRVHLSFTRVFTTVTPQA